MRFAEGESREAFLRLYSTLFIFPFEVPFSPPVVEEEEDSSLAGRRFLVLMGFLESVVSSSEDVSARRCWEDSSWGWVADLGVFVFFLCRWFSSSSSCAGYCES